MSRYIPTSPDAIRLDKEAYGKPFLAGGAGAENVQFNLAHSDNVAAVAIAKGRKVGVDIEYVRHISELHSIVRHYFTPREQTLVENAAETEKNKKFMVCWTRKEAYIKAVGKGLSIPLSSFDASIPDGATGRFLDASGDDGAMRGWWVSDLPPIPDCAGAVVSDGEAEEYRYLRWSAERCASERESHSNF